MKRKGNRMDHRHSVSRWALAALMGLALAVAGALWHSPVAAQVVEIADACDVLVVPAAEVDPAAPEPGVVGVAPGTTILLVGPAVHVCTPTFEGPDAAGECELTAGNGITIEVDGVTLDLNGRSIVSASNVAAAGDAAGCDVENAGVAVGGDNVMVTNSSMTVSVVENFTANFDIKSNGSRLVGTATDTTGDGFPDPGSSNLYGGRAHGGGALAIDKSANLTVSGVELNDGEVLVFPALADPGPEADGDNGIDLKRCDDPANITIENSVITGRLTGVRIKGCNGVTLTGNTITGGCEAVEILNSIVTPDPLEPANMLNVGVCPIVEPPEPAAMG